ncbi:zinc finger protein 704 isoform X1 [Latimeria chalumnae]|uniref:zinc finger protein 704 isoform X1 n=1 Tax=Latimeria chalumnae TaxID=7897 RepID=UPI0006D93A9E|nr:PREDICTED: zinc finger protein 704-like isoform X2 [Latimeria chalumnae]|eukprot:XP_014352603.1 PREDICTED: zinc finger protein 704-like isoform X2 [Latimeria chalumnae]
MSAKRHPKRSVVGARIYAPSSPRQAGCSGPPNGLCCGVVQACKNDPAGNSVYTVLLDNGSLREYSEEAIANAGAELRAAGKAKMRHLQKVGAELTCRKIEINLNCNGKVAEMERQEPCRKSPTERPVVNGERRAQESRWLGWPEASERVPAPRPLGTVPEQKRPATSAHIPVPRQRKTSDKAHMDEVMAANVLTSLSTSPLVLSPPADITSLDQYSKMWSEGPAALSSCSSSGNWSWDAPSDRSTPSTPSPPLPGDIPKTLLPSAHSDDSVEETETAHFMFEDHPVPRKRKNSVKVMFKCMWKNCEKVLTTSSGIQRHVRTLHLGRNGDSDHSDGEEDFYYTEIDVNVDTLTDGLSSLTPTSPTSTVPPPFPPAEAPKSEQTAVKPEAQLITPLSQSAPTTLCHIRSDHAYQVSPLVVFPSFLQATAPGSIPDPPALHPTGAGFSVSWQPPPVLFRGITPCMAQIRAVGVMEKRLQAQHPTVIKTLTAATLSPKPATGTRKPRGEAKKCRKVYGMENRDMWCTACRWKKACQRFID